MTDEGKLNLYQALARRWVREQIGNTGIGRAFRDGWPYGGHAIERPDQQRLNLPLIAWDTHGTFGTIKIEFIHR